MDMALLLGWMGVVRVVQHDTSVVQLQHAPAECLPQGFGGEHVLGWAEGDLVGVQQQHHVRCARVAEVVRREHHGTAGSLLGVHDLADRARTDNVQSRERLVQQEQVGLLGYALGNHHALALASGELLDLAPFTVAHLDPVERGIDRLMVEGGSSVHTQFLTEGLADELQLVVAPLFVGDSRAPRFVGDGSFPWSDNRRAELADVRRIGDVVLLRYALSERFDEVEEPLHAS